LKNERYNMKA